MNSSADRYIQIAKWKVKELRIDLQGLHVLTECASKAYGFLPFIAALTGAKVHALGRSSSYGSFSDNQSFIQSLLKKEGLEDKVIFHENQAPDCVYGETDILTNSGFLRPISEEKISRLKKTAVIPLMWEPWELRPGEIDIKTCQKNKIPVIGTNEHFKHADMYAYPGALALKLLFEVGLEIANNTIVLLGGGLTGRLIAQTFERNQVNFLWFGEDPVRDERMRPYRELSVILKQDRLDGIVMADHVFNREIIGKKGYITFTDLKRQFPYVRFCHICGSTDAQELGESGLNYFPQHIKPFGYMSYETINLGWEPVITLACAGLKVGEIAARCRLSGMDINASISKTVDYGIGMDFEGGFMNFTP